MNTMDHIITPIIAVVGGGVSGSLTAIQLLRSATEKLDIHLIERSGVFGRGVAYGTEEYSSLLNVPAGKMSAFPDDPRHFLRWLQTTDFYIEQEQPATETSFVPRTVYGRYISEVLEAAEREAAAMVRLLRHHDGVLDIVTYSNEALLYLQSGDHIRASKVVIAFGNFSPRNLSFVDLAFSDSPRYVRNPWSSQALDQISSEDSVLIIGTGLTMVDVVLGLHARGHQGKVFAISKHGLLPQAHRVSSTTFAVPNFATLPNTARQLMRYVRQQIDTAANTANIDWRVIFDSLRSITPVLWQRLPLDEKRRFLRHIQPYWDSHRHRMPPQVVVIIDTLRTSEQLVIHKGMVKQFHPQNYGVRAEIGTLQGQLVLDVQHIINCTGPNTDYSTVTDPLLGNLLKRGLVQPDSLRLGLDAESNGALRDESGCVSTLLYTIGPSLKGLLWEATAVPEIRQQAVALSKALLDAVTLTETVLATGY